MRCWTCESGCWTHCWPCESDCAWISSLWDVVLEMLDCMGKIIGGMRRLLLLIYHQLSKKLNGAEEQSLLKRLWEPEGMARDALKYFLKAGSDTFGLGRAASLVEKKGGVSSNKELV